MAEIVGSYMTRALRTAGISNVKSIMHGADN